LIEDFKHQTQWVSYSPFSYLSEQLIECLTWKW